jgi:hypothetical protein
VVVGAFSSKVKEDVHGKTNSLPDNNQLLEGNNNCKDVAMVCDALPVPIYTEMKERKSEKMADYCGHLGIK